jgi:cytochrome P450
MMKNDMPATDWNPRDPSVLDSQLRAYDEMRERCPVAHSDFLGWSVFRHQDVASILTDPETFSSETKRHAIPAGMDPPEHTAYREMVERYFVDERMAEFEPRCRAIADELLTQLRSRDRIDFVSEFADPFAVGAFCAFLGWPRDLEEHARYWIHNNQHASFTRDREAGKTLALELVNCVKDQLDVRRAARAGTRDDVTTSLMSETVAGERLSDDDVASALRNWIAGHGTVSAGIGIVANYLAEHPNFQQDLRQNPNLLPTAIDEILRIDGPLVANQRTTTRDIAIGDREIAAGERLSLMWISANRDPRTFDSPEEVRLDRDPANNFVFGAGIHVCPGAPLARLELRVAIEELLNHTDQFSPDNSAERTRDVYPSNGYRTLGIRMT